MNRPSLKSLQIGGEVSSSPSPRVLFVEDDPHVRLLGATLLLRSGFDVVAVGSAEDALGRIQTERFDLIVTDYRLPGKNGDAVASAAQDAQPRIPVVLVTGLPREVPLWLRCGNRSVPVIQKPFNLQELTTAMRRELRSAAA